MNKLSSIIVLTQLHIASSFGVLVYSNSFDHVTSLNDFIININRSASISVSEGQLKISSLQTGRFYGRATSMISVSDSVPNLNPILNSNLDPISWGVNLSNSDGNINNRAEFVLASTSANPFDLDAHGYAVTIGGSAGSRMSFFRFNYGLGGGRDTLITIDDGLSPLPSLGTLRVDYDPLDDYWEMYFSQSNSYQNPLNLETRVGSAFDGEYTGTNLNFIGFSGLNSGEDYFDNFSIRVIPEPSFVGLLVFGSSVIYFLKRKMTR